MRNQKYLYIFLCGYICPTNENDCSMKDKIIAVLKTMYANLGLSDKAFGGVASMLEKTVTKEEDIEAAVKAPEIEVLIKAIQGESDSLRTRNAQLAKELNELKGGQPDGKKHEESGNDDVNKALIARIEAMEKSFKERADKVKLEERLSGVRKTLKDKGAENDNILGLVMKDAAFGEGETDDKAVERLKAVYDTTYKQFYGNGPVPPSGNGGNGNSEHPDSSLIEALRSNHKLAAESNNQK